MKSLFNYLREMSTARSAKKKLTNKSLASFALILCTLGYLTAPAQAEGSKELVQNGGNRPYTEWSTARTANIPRRTLLQVFVKSGETINLGSSVHTSSDNKDIVLRDPSGTERVFDVRNNGGRQGFIDTVAKETAGPLPNAGGYNPHTFTATQTGIYEVEFHSPATSGNPPPISTTAQFPTDDTQRETVAAWDITVRDSGGNAKKGRVFTNYVAMNMGGNDRSLNSVFFIQTKDGFLYRTAMNGLDPYGFLFFGNSRGFLDLTDNSTLYHSTKADENTLFPFQGNVQVQRPDVADTSTNITHRVFFNRPDPETLFELGIPTTPPVPAKPTNFKFTGKANGNQTYVGAGGDFSFNTTSAGSYQIIIDTDTNGIFDPSKDRVLRDVTAAGSKVVTWDGKDKNGVDLPRRPNNDPYDARIILRIGEYHFPMLDAESNPNGLVIEMLNPPSPQPPGFNRFTIYYNDENYKTKNGTSVNLDQSGRSTTPGTPTNPRNASIGINSSAGEHEYSGGYGDFLGIDTWAYFPSEATFAQVIITEQVYKVSGTVYEDFGTGGANNNNNTFDNGEKTIGKVTVNLFQDANNDGQADGAAVKTIETNATGAYQFTDVSPGRYIIRVDTRDTDIPSTYAIGTPNPIKINVSADLTNQNFGFNTVSKTCPAGSFLPEQTFLNFQNPQLQSGTALSVGAVYRFSNVATDIDALVEIKSFNNATLTQIDVNNFGVQSAFQPEVRANSQNAGNYSVDFDIKFVQSGTTTPVELRKVLATGIDIDGDNVRVREASELGGNQFTSYAIDSNSRLTATELSPTRIKFESKTTFNLDGITINSLNQGSAFYDNNTQSIEYRAGLIIDPGSATNIATQRLTSLVFDCVEYNLAVTSNPNVILVKRITAINRNRNQNPNDGTVLNQFVDDTTSSQKNNDNSPNWPDNYLLGAIDAGKVKREDEIEYTVYFLNIGNANASNVRLCDRITANQDFQPNTYAAGRGIQLKLGDSAETNLTNANDNGDRAQLIASGGAVPPNCNLQGGNTNGTVQIDITGNTGSPSLTTMPGSTGKGTPNNSYGLFRFTTKVQP